MAPLAAPPRTSPANPGAAEAGVIWPIKTRRHIRPYRVKGLLAAAVWEPPSGAAPATGNVKIKLDVTNWFQALLGPAAAALPRQNMPLAPRNGTPRTPRRTTHRAARHPRPFRVRCARRGR